MPFDISPQVYLRVACNLEYENLENGNLECNLISKISIKVISKKSEGYLEFNLEKDNLESMVRNFCQTHSKPVPPFSSQIHNAKNTFKTVLASP